MRWFVSTANATNRLTETSVRPVVLYENCDFRLSIRWSLKWKTHWFLKTYYHEGGYVVRYKFVKLSNTSGLWTWMYVIGITIGWVTVRQHPVYVRSLRSKLWTRLQTIHRSLKYTWTNIANLCRAVYYLIITVNCLTINERMLVFLQKDLRLLSSTCIDDQLTHFSEKKLVPETSYFV